jgi:putative protease
MAKNPIGRVTHYYDHLHVAVLALTDTIRVGDWLHIVGHSTDFPQPVVSLQINHQPVTEALPGQDVALRVNDRVREHDIVFRITAQEASQLAGDRLLEGTR